MESIEEFKTKWSECNHPVRRIRLITGDTIFATEYIDNYQEVELILDSLVFGIFNIKNIKEVMNDEDDTN